MPIKSIGFSFSITTPSEATIVPEQKDIVNNLDHIGAIFALPRISGERNPDYRDRIWDVNVHPLGSTYSGVVSGMGRDLGMLRDRAVKIELQENSAGDAIAPNPRVDLLSNRIVLYSDWRPNGTETIDKEIYFYQPDSEGYYLDDLVAAINTSSCFSASIYSDIRPNLHSCLLVQDTSLVMVVDELVPAYQKFSVFYNRILENSIHFSEVDVFRTLVSGTPSAAGEFSITHETGEIQTYLVPSGDGAVGYHTSVFPMDIEWSPIQIYTLQDDEFQSELFHTNTLDSGTEVNALLNAEGAEIYHQLFLESKIFWGE